MPYKFHILCVYSEEQSVYLTFDLNASDGQPKSCQAERNNPNQFCNDVS